MKIDEKALEAAWATLSPDGAAQTDLIDIGNLRKTAATHMVILQKQFPDLMTDSVLTDMFGWTQGTLAKMKRIYVSDAAVITAMTRRK